jgi:hypothetical protein
MSEPHTSPEAALIKSVGGFGCAYINDQSEINGNFHGIQIIEDCVFSILESSNMENASALTSKTLYAGLIIESHFTKVQLSSGSVILYKH